MYSEKGVILYLNSNQGENDNMGTKVPQYLTLTCFVEQQLKLNGNTFREKSDFI